VEKSWPLREFTTQTIDKTLAPTFEFEAWTQVHWNETKCGLLVFICYDKVKGRQKQELGRVEVPISLIVEAQKTHKSKRAPQSLPTALP
jgi:hypothetical protein